MKIIHDLIKMKYVEEGFIRDLPYHLISDEEMAEAFLSMEGNEDYFHTFYPLPDESMAQEYDKLVAAILNEIQLYLMSKHDGGEIHVIPDWVYSYMFGNVIGPMSDIHDKHDLFVLLGTDNLEDEFNMKCYRECYRASLKWIGRYMYRDLTAIVRPPTMFGEPHVIKYLRLREANALSGGEVNAVS